MHAHTCVCVCAQRVKREKKQVKGNYIRIEFLRSQQWSLKNCFVQWREMFGKLTNSHYTGFFVYQMISKSSHVEILRWAEQGLSPVKQGRAGCIMFLTNEEIGASKCVQGHKGSKW